MKTRTVSLVAPALCIAVAGVCCFEVLAGEVGGPVPAFGLLHTGIGQAQLSAGTDHLVVSNIGSSGKDGVSIDLGEAQGFQWEFDLGPAPQLPPQCVVQSDVIVQYGGPGAGQDQKVACAIFHEDSSGQGALSLDVGLLAPGALRVEALLNGQVQQLYEFPPPFPDPLLVVPLPQAPPAPDRLVVSNIGSSGKDGVSCAFCVDSFFDVEYQIDIGASVGGNPPVILDELRVSLLDLAPTTVVPPLNRAEIRASVPGTLFEFSIVDEAIELFDLPHRALGQAQMSSSGGTLTVSNIGSSGKDGVRQELPPSTQSNVYELAPPVPTGPYVIAVNSSVSLDGLPPGKPVIGSLYGDTTNPVELVVDFSALGAQTQTLEINLDGKLAFVQNGMAGVLVSFPDPPDIAGLQAEGGVLVQTMQWFQPTPITVSGGPTILGDEVRVIPEPGGSAGLPALEEIAASEIRVVGGLDTLIIINQAALPAAAPCPWDCGDPPDGDIGVVDFLALLAQWGQVGAACDFDGGGVGVTDFLELLANWGTCP